MATAPRFACLLRRLASSREDPLDNAANASALLSGFGVEGIDGDRFRQWRGEFLIPNQPGTPRSGAGEGAGPSRPPMPPRAGWRRASSRSRSRCPPVAATPSTPC